MAVDDTYTKLLLHMDGPDLSTTFTDEAGHILTPSGTCNLKVDNKKFGESAGFFNSGYLTTPDSADFNFDTQDFTIEAWVYQTSTVNYAVIMSSGQSSWGDGCTAFILDGTVGKVRLVRNYQNSTLYAADGPAFVNNQWMHIAAVRKNGYVTIFVNGVAGTPVFFNNLPLLYNGGSNTKIGGGNWDGANGMFHGYIDELRVSKGIARYTTHFMPPEKAFSPLNKLIDIMVIGGGGGGGSGKSSTYEGGGGGAGGFLYQTGLPIDESSISIVVGTGGAKDTNGAASSFGTLSANGGGHGTCSTAATTGGSGGGAFNASGAAGTPGQGNAGGSGNGSNSGGGGGAGGAGYAGTDGTYPRQGGTGISCSISGTPTMYAGGGGGVGSAAGAGGAGGGGAGNMTGAGYAGTPNTGGGGGGGKSSGNYAGGAGGSGIVIVRYKTADFGMSSGGTITTDGEYTVHTFTVSGTLILAAVHTYALTGSAVFGPFALPAFVEDPESSELVMTASIPENTAIDLYTAIVASEPVEQDYVLTDNGAAIPGMLLAAAGMNLFIKAVLRTQDNLYTPVLQELSFSIIEKLDKKKIWIMFTADGRLKKPNGNIRIQYSKATGTLVGPNNGQVDDFDVSFAPTLPTPIFNPNDAEYLACTLTSVSSMFAVIYESYKSSDEYILCTLTSSSSLIHVNDLG